MFSIALGLFLLSSCGPVPVPGVFMDVDGSLLPVRSKKVDDPAHLQAGTRRGLRYLFPEAVFIRTSSDLAVRMSVSGSVTVALFAREKDESPFLEASFEGLGEPLLEFRIPVPAGASLAGVELSLDSAQAATLEGFAVSSPYIGYRAAGREGSPAVVSLGVQRSFASELDQWPGEVRLPAAAGPGWSVVIRQGSSGTLRVVGKTATFEAWPRADKPLAIPLELTGGLSVLVAAVEADDAGRSRSAGGIAEASLHFGGDAPLTDLHAMLSGVELTGDYKLYRWDLLPDTLVFDFADYAVQDRYFKRLAFFAEKPGFRGRLALDHEIASLHGWNAHNYAPWTLANFYNLAADTAFRLNPSELALLELLLDYGIVEKEANGRYRPGIGSIISITRQASRALRRIFMDHEAAHAVLFQDEAYRALSERLWNAHDPATRRFWLRHLRWRHYDITDQYLIVNEMQGYLVQQSAPGAVTYIRDNVLVRLAAAYPAEAAGLAADTPSILAFTARDALALDAYLREHWDVSAGRFGRVRRINLP